MKRSLTKGFFLCLQAPSEYLGHVLTGEGIVACGVDEGGIAVFLDVFLLAAALGDFPSFNLIILLSFAKLVII